VIVVVPAVNTVTSPVNELTEATDGLLLVNVIEPELFDVGAAIVKFASPTCGGWLEK
jgi:hypothetical protein